MAALQRKLSQHVGSVGAVRDGDTGREENSREDEAESQAPMSINAITVNSNVSEAQQSPSLTSAIISAQG